jgi:formylglycine-generating enzyme required for sulfatase activity
LIGSVVIEEAGNERRQPAEAGPIVVGGSVRCTIVLPGAGTTDEPLLLGVSGGAPFAQRGPQGPEATVGGVPLSGSVWLRDGDCIRSAQTEIVCRIERDQVRYRVEHDAGEGEGEDATLPPLTVVPPGGGATIAPTAFTPPVEVAPSRALNGWLLLVGILALLLGAILWYTFTARSVHLVVDPPPDQLDIQGGPLGALPVAFRFGDRYLLLPGNYRLRATKTGYHELDETWQVDDRDAQRQRFAMIKLPGRITFQIVPAEGARVYLGSALLGRSPLGEVEIPAGDQSIRIEADRYLPHEQALSVLGMGQSQTVAVELTPGWSAVRITSEPPGATLTVDGTASGATPVTVDLMAGEHRLLVTHPGYTDWVRSLTIAPNEPLILPVTLSLADATVALTSQPDGATVRVDGEYRGRTPLELNLTPGEAHRLQLGKSGYADLDQTLSLNPGETRTLTLNLKAHLGTVRLQVSPSDAQVLVDGRPRGQGSQVLRLGTGPHRIEVRREGYVSQQHSVTARSGIEQSLKVELSAVAVTPAPREDASGTGALAPAPAPAPVQRTGAARIQAADGQMLQRISGGRFKMGSSRREQGRRSNEGLRDVILTRPFYLGVREVTNGEFRRFRPEHRSGAMAGQSLDLDDQPVVNVTWQDAAAYANWLSLKESLPTAYVQGGGRLVPAVPMTRGYRLPTEAEWSWAARQATATPRVKYYWGPNWPPIGKPGNFGDESARPIIGSVLVGYDDGFPVAAPVGRFGANRLGLYDMEGNVAEWCHDYYGVTPGGGRGTASDPAGPSSGKHHVIRGGGWRHHGISELRIGFRDYDKGKRPDVGFRLARYAD